ncbi:HD domain-containing protein [Leptolyngbya sp. AN02str]|uniref:HD domain-containing protein n=1 Tax=Leptolyngbya sp. AN02str TaxID=3423363 RepID=UPI003D31C6CC
MNQRSADKLTANLEQQIKFIIEADKLKGILRKTSPIGEQRKENSAEHSWQVMLSALVPVEHANQEVNILRVLKMLMIHDLVEIDVGDTLHYNKSSSTYENETIAARRIFGILPDKQGEEFLSLWKEFEAKETDDAKFATSVDRLMAFIMNSNNNGGSWKELELSAEQVIRKNASILEGATLIWSLAAQLITEAVEKGYLKNDTN